MTDKPPQNRPAAVSITGKSSGNVFMNVEVIGDGDAQIGLKRLRKSLDYN